MNPTGVIVLKNDVTVFNEYKYSVISKMYITSLFRFLLLSTSCVRMSEGTFCRVEFHMYSHICILV